MSRIDKVGYQLVDLLPNPVLDGVVYVSLEHRTIIHKCCSGCGERVVLDLSPAGWKITLDGETISLAPSVGNGELPCNSHYWIRAGKVVWAKPLTAQETRESQEADREALVSHFDVPTTPSVAPPWWHPVRRLRHRRGSADN